MFDYIDLHTGPLKHLAYSLLGPRLMVFPNVMRQLPIDLSLFNTWLDTKVSISKDLYAFLEERNTARLGHYHEALWEFFIQSNPQYNLIAKNVQVFKNNQTLGEFDFLLQDRAHKNVFHLEVATKYYLEHVLDGQTYWIGPNLRDRFDLKAEHLIRHQIQLGKTPAGRKTLKELGITNYRKVISIGGMLFSHSTHPHHISHTAPEHRRAKHMTLAEYQNTKDNEQWLILPKHDWLAPLLLKEGERETSSKDAICERLDAQFQDNPTPIMVACMQPKKRHPQLLKEHHRLFITPNNWADSADEVIKRAYEQ
jgi:hypothetical protein